MFSKRNKLLYSTVIILTLLYILSFTKSCTNTDKREVIKTALVNQKYEKEISEIILKKGEEEVVIRKKGELWIIDSRESILENTFPCDQQKVQNLLKDLITIRKMYKISDKNYKNTAYVLTTDDTFTLKYTFPDGSHTLYFGNQDFSLTSRFLITDKNTQIYEIDTSFEKYLSVNTQNWVEPYIISQVILGKITEQDIQSTKVQIFNENENSLSQLSHLSQITDIQKLLDLRHAGLPDFATEFPLQTALQINLELGNKSEIEMEIFTTNKESQFIVKCTYKNQHNEKNPDTTTYAKISEWTYNKIKEITL